MKRTFRPTLLVQGHITKRMLWRRQHPAPNPKHGNGMLIITALTKRIKAIKRDKTLLRRCERAWHSPHPREITTYTPFRKHRGHRRGKTGERRA